MTVSSSTSSVTFAGNGVSTVFPFSFPIPGSSPTDETNVQVLIADTTVTPPTLTVLSPSLWSVTGISTPTAPSGGGAVTYNPGTPLAAGKYLTILRNIQAVQGVSIANQSAFFGQVVEGGLDYVTMLVQQLQTQVSRALQVAIGDPGGLPNALPIAVQRANMALLFDAGGQPYAGALPSITVSSTMQAFVQAASLAAARTALGVSGALISYLTVASPVTSVDFTGLDATYDEYEIRFNNLLPATAATELWIRISQAGVFKSGATDYRHVRHLISNGAGHTVADSTGDAKMLVQGALNNTAGRGSQGVIRFSRPGVSSEFKMFGWELREFDGTNLVRTDGVGFYQIDGNAVDGVRIQFSSGNVATGNLALYGYRKT